LRTFYIFFDEELATNRIAMLNEVMDYHKQNLENNPEINVNYTISEINQLKLDLTRSVENKITEEFYFVLKEMRIKFAKTKDKHLIENQINQDIQTLINNEDR